MKLVLDDGFNFLFSFLHGKLLLAKHGAKRSSMNLFLLHVTCMQALMYKLIDSTDGTLAALVVTPSKVFGNWLSPVLAMSRDIFSFN